MDVKISRQQGVLLNGARLTLTHLLQSLTRYARHTGSALLWGLILAGTAVVLISLFGIVFTAILLLIVSAIASLVLIALWLITPPIVRSIGNAFPRLPGRG